ncbi:hypothetical protein I79_025169 [Cricetulus griseus]|uniref:Uncharacterized protein n=1 Tax=Cricetulus griseus TaxID=10029 RepID=G3IMM9_CRIGR|nr:hypothetical protein I79_025169 [Cricetulus griseus]
MVTVAVSSHRTGSDFALPVPGGRLPLSRVGLRSRPRLSAVSSASPGRSHKATPHSVVAAARPNTL